MPIESAEVTMHAKTPIEVDEHVARQNLRLIEALEDLDDVQRVTANFDLPPRFWPKPPRLERLHGHAAVIVLGIDPGTAATGYGLVEREWQQAAPRRLRLPRDAAHTAAAACACSRSTAP